jgi:DNA repair protein RadC
MATFEGIEGVARANMSELQQQPGIGASTAARIKAAFELGRRLLIERPSDRPQIRTPADAANLVMAEMGLLEQEHLRTILLDTKNRVVDIPTIYVGSVNTTMIRVAEVFREAIRRNCPSLIVLHNHPSGDVSPSPEDVAVTRQIVEAGKLMDVEVLDHLIVSRTVFVSLKERGLGF